MRAMVALLGAVIVCNTAVAKQPVTDMDDPIIGAYNYGYDYGICVNAPRKLRANPRSDAGQACTNMRADEDKLRSLGYWCITNSEKNIGTPCTPLLQGR